MASDIDVQRLLYQLIERKTSKLDTVRLDATSGLTEFKWQGNNRKISILLSNNNFRAQHTHSFR